MIEEFQRNYDLFGTTSYSFTDDCFNDSREKVETICGAILKLPFKIDFTSYARVDVAVKFPDTADLMVEAGASSLFWGLESFHPEAAKKAGKGTPPDRVKEFLVAFKKKHGQKCFGSGSFITGLPGEPESSVLDTLDWLTHHDPLHAVAFSPLLLSPYFESLDKTVVDFADYARNPSQYGFTHVGSTSTEWAHQLMNFKQADELADFCANRWLATKGAGLFNSPWQYYHFRSLGYSKEDLFSRFLDNTLKFELANEVAGRNSEFLKKYWTDLTRHNPPAPRW